MQSSNIKYLPQIDHLRAAAAIWIILYHGEQIIGAYLRTGGDFVGQWQHTLNPFLAVVREGHSAVALFMVLSGFIFTYGSYGKIISYGGFLKNRILKIYPLFLCVIFLSLAVNPQVFSLSDFVTTVLPLANVRMLPNGPLVSMSWAIAVEFQFYLIFPFLLRFLNDDAFKFVAAAISCALLFRLIGIGLGANARDLSYWHLAGRIDQFVAAWRPRQWFEMCT
jgi:peptidoglycan/LPS O-acetylase OafA/YrhL